VVSFRGNSASVERARSGSVFGLCHILNTDLLRGIVHDGAIGRPLFTVCSCHAG
jgi:hypothetical protein